MCARKTGVENFSRTFGEFGGQLQKQKWSLTLNEKFEAGDDCRLGGVKKNKTKEDFSSLGQDPTKKYEKDHCKMASEIGQPGQDLIQDR